MKSTTLIEATGIQFTEETKNWFYGFTESGLLVEVKLTSKKTKQVIVGYNLTGKEQLRFCSDLSDRWTFKSKVLTNLNNLDEIPCLIKEAVQVFEANDYSFKGELKSRKLLDEGYFEGIAAVVQVAVKHKRWKVLDREVLEFDDHDNLVTIGKSKAYEAAKAINPDYSGRREHIVPCVMIKEEIIRMVEEDDAPIVEIAQTIKTNLAIVMISDEEQKLVDSVYKTTMPQGWTFGDSVTARLDVMNIAY